MDPLIDVNVYLSRWPFRRLRGDETPQLLAKLRQHGVTQAWAGSFDALLHRDMAAVNTRLSQECSQHGEGMLIPMGAVNPRLPDWEEDVRRCHEEHQMPGLRLHPNYHGYKLDDPVCIRLLELAAERGLIVQIAVTMEDERTQHPLVQVPHVDVAPLADQARRWPQLKLVLLNAFRSLRIEGLGKLVETRNVYFDIAMLEAVGRVGNLVAQVGADRVLFGSYSPFFYFESALLKLREAELGAFQQQAVSSGAARKILTGQ